MAYQDWVSLINDSYQGTGAGAALNTAVTATLSPVTGGGSDVAQVNPANLGGWYQSMVIRCTARGFITTTATSTTFTGLLAARVGNTGSTYVTLASTAAITTPASAITGIQWRFKGLIRCTQVASSGNTLSAEGEFIFQNSASAPALATANAVFAPMPAISGESVAAVDTTQLQGISLRGTLAGANATVQLTQWLAEALN